MQTFRILFCLTYRTNQCSRHSSFGMSTSRELVVTESFFASDCWCVRNLPLNRNKVSFMINYNLPDIRTFDGLGGGDGHWVASQLSLLEKRLRLFLLTVSLFIIYRPSWRLLECICSLFFIGLEPTRWPSDNCLHVMACSCTIRSIWVWPLMIFCLC